MGTHMVLALAAFPTDQMEDIQVADIHVADILAEAFLLAVDNNRTQEVAAVHHVVGSHKDAQAADARTALCYSVGHTQRAMAAEAVLHMQVEAVLHMLAVPHKPIPAQGTQRLELAVLSDVLAYLRRAVPLERHREWVYVFVIPNLPPAPTACPQSGRSPVRTKCSFYLSEMVQTLCQSGLDNTILAASDPWAMPSPPLVTFSRQL